jgi:hypothetical protein
MRRGIKLGLSISALALIVVFGAAALLVGQTRVSSDAIRYSVTRTDAMVARFRLFAAVDTLDGDRKRGLLLIE